MELVPKLGELGRARREPEGLRLRGHERTSRTASSCRSSSAATRACARFASVQGSLVMYPIHAFGSRGAEGDAGCRRMAAGEAIGCFGLTEPDFGSNPAGMRTPRRQGRRRLRAERQQVLDHQRLHRRRRGGVGQARRRRRSAASWSRADARASRAATSTASSRCARRSPRELILRGLPRARDDAMLPGVEGLKGPLSCLTQARYGIAWGAIGAADGLLRRGARVRASRACSSASRSPATSSCRRSSRRCSRRSPRRSSSALRLGRLKDAGQAAPAAGLAGQAQQRAMALRDRARGARHPRRQRHHRRVPGRSATC